MPKTKPLSFKAWKRKALKNPKLKAEYDALEEEFAAASKKIEARKKAAAKRKPVAHTKKSPPPREQVSDSERVTGAARRVRNCGST